MRQATEKQTEQTKIRAEKKKGTSHKHTEGAQLRGNQETKRDRQKDPGVPKGHIRRAEAQDRMIAMTSKSSL